MRTRWRNRLGDAGQSETCNQLPMPEATSTCVEMTNLQGLADLERLEGCRHVLPPRISSLRCEQWAAPRSFSPLRGSKSARERGLCDKHHAINKTMTNCGCGTEQVEKLERKTLISLLAINAVMFLVEFVMGWLAESTGLISDSLDMLADAAVYGLSLYAIGRGLKKQIKAARLSGILQILLGTGVLLEVMRRLLLGSEPESLRIMGIGIAALVANIYCLMLISGHRNSGVHMRASWIFSTNDVIANLGVIVSGFLVWLLGNRFPDLIVGAMISVVIVRGGIRILQEAKQEKKGHARA